MSVKKRGMPSKGVSGGNGLPLKPEYFFAREKYSPKVFVSDWQLEREAEPKDNNPYCPPGGNYFISTYNRMGTDEGPHPTSETRDMLEQKYTACSPPCQIDIESLETRLADLRRSKIFEFKSPSHSDYTSTMKGDYTPQNPRPTNPPGYPYFPPAMNRLSISELSDGRSVRRPGNYRFMDDKIEHFYELRKLRPMRGYVSFDPARCVHTFANEPVNGYSE